MAEQGSGAGRLLGFSFSGTTIQPGDGPTFFVTFSTSVVPEPTTVSLCTAEEAISSSQGVAFFTDTECGSVVLDVEGIDVALITDSGPLDQGVSSEMTVVMSTPSDVYGVELHITDTPESVTALDVQAGPLVSDLNGTISFSEVNGEIIALWFSLTGDYIPAGSEGDLFVIDYVVDDSAPNGDCSFEFTDETTFSSNSAGQSMYWNGVGSTTNIGLPDVSLTLVQSGDDRFDIIWIIMMLLADSNLLLMMFLIIMNLIVFLQQIEFQQIGVYLEMKMVVMQCLLGFSFNGTTIEPGNGMIASIYMEPLNEEFTSELLLRLCFIKSTSRAIFCFCWMC